MLGCVATVNLLNRHQLFTECNKMLLMDASVYCAIAVKDRKLLTSSKFDVIRSMPISGYTESGWMFLLVPAHPGRPGQRAIKRSCVCMYVVCATVV